MNVNNASSNVNRNIGARQVVNNQVKPQTNSSFPLGKIRNPQKFSRETEKLGLTTTREHHEKTWKPI